jgi:hypothetical protein
VIRDALAGLGREEKRQAIRLLRALLGARARRPSPTRE